ncbi:MAG TPA: membrane dipeptidase [Pseudolysinimonas sp.]|nr:membrane dipeptidase [Pseudolysinimonas sp.]
MTSEPTTQVVVDGLQSSNFDRKQFEDIRSGGISCVHATVVIWEDARTTLDILGTWNRMFREHSDLIAMARTAADVREIAASGRIAVILGFQNASPFEDDLDMVQVFWDLGIRFAQLTYNIQNHVGSSCYDPVDGGVTRFGSYVIQEMNRVGMVVDLSHVGPRTTREAIDISSRPVAITHANPASVYPHPRNKSDEILRALVERGGILGLAPYPHLTGNGPIDLSQWNELVLRAIDVVGIDHVAIGSDSSHGWDDDKLQWIRKGRWSHQVQLGPATADRQGWLPWPEFFRTPADFPNLVEGMSQVGLAQDDIEKIIGGNWMRMFEEGFAPVAQLSR